MIKSLQFLNTNHKTYGVQLLVIHLLKWIIYYTSENFCCFQKKPNIKLERKIDTSAASELLKKQNHLLEGILQQPA